MSSAAEMSSGRPAIVAGVCEVSQVRSPVALAAFSSTVTVSPERMSSISHCRRCAASSAGKKSTGEAPIKACAGVSRLAAAALLTRMKRPLSSCTVRPIESASTMSLRNVQSCSASCALPLPILDLPARSRGLGRERVAVARRDRCQGHDRALAGEGDVAFIEFGFAGFAPQQQQGAAPAYADRQAKRRRSGRDEVGREGLSRVAAAVPLMARTAPRRTSVKKASRGQRAPIAPLGAAAMQTSASASSARTTAWSWPKTCCSRWHRSAKDACSPSKFSSASSARKPACTASACIRS